MIDLFIVDFDGFVVDSMEVGLRQQQGLAVELGLGRPNMAVLRKWVGVPVDAYALGIARDCGWPEGSARRFEQIILDTEEPEFGLFDGVLEMLVRLRDRGKILCLLTNRDPGSFPKVCAKIRLPEFVTGEKGHMRLFDVAQVHGDAQEAKPHPGVFSGPIGNLIRDMQIPLSRIALTGDTRTDWETARNFGIPTFVGAVTGVTTIQEFEAMGVPNSHIIINPADLDQVPGIAAP